MQENVRRILKLPTDTPLKYWLKYWKYCVEKFTNINRYDLRVENPHFIINDVVTEIKYNSFRNSDNRRVYKDKLGKCLKCDKAFSDLYKPLCLISFENWDKSPMYVSFACKEILRSMNENYYLKKLAKELADSINNHSDLSDTVKESIRFYTDLFVTEFICLGVDIKDVDHFIEEDNICISDVDNIVYVADTFYELKRSDFSTEELYHRAVKNRLDNRSIDDYINNIFNHFNKQPKDAHVLLRLLGVKGSVDAHIQDAHIYSIDNYKYLKESGISKIEEPDESFQYVNISIPIKHRFFHTSVRTAKERATNLLDFMSLNIHQDQEISISKQFAVVEIDGYEHVSSASIHDDIERLRYLRDAESLNLSRHSDLLSDILKGYVNSKKYDENVFRQIANAIRWYNKAMFSNKDEDKLLYSWIAMESILKVSDGIKESISTNNKECNTLHFTQELCSSILARNKFYSYAKNIYLELVHATNQFDNYYDISLDTIQNAKLDIQYGQIIDLSFFFNSLPSIIKEINDEIYKDELIQLQIFYKDEQGIKSYKNNIREDIVFIYRLRNLIAHNATSSPFITHLYAFKSQFICGSLIQAIRYQCNKYGVDIDGAIMHIYTECKIFEDDIKNKIQILKQPCRD